MNSHSDNSFSEAGLNWYELRLDGMMTSCLGFALFFAFVFAAKIRFVLNGLDIRLHFFWVIASREGGDGMIASCLHPIVKCLS